jgi:AraC-like DNA-binding protein
MPIPLVNVVEFAQVIDLLDNVASPVVVNRALAASDVSRRLLSQTQGFIPYRLEASVLEHVARSVGDPYLGARAAPQFDYDAYATYARYVLSANTLGAALTRGRAAFPMIQPGGEIVLNETKDHLLAGRRSRLGTVLGHHHLDDGALFILIGVIQHFLGSDWRPVWVEATGEEGSRIQYLEDKIEVPVHKGAAIPLVAIEKTALSTPNPAPLPPDKIVSRSDLSVLSFMQPARTMTDTVALEIQTQLTLEDASEDLVARRLALGRRTLQRSLQKEGTSFREIKARIIEHRARVLLAETDLAVATIARTLGYSEPKSFQRAFRKWTGLWPHAYRTVCSGECE